MNRRKATVKRSIYHAYQFSKIVDLVLDKQNKKRRTYRGVRLTYGRLCYEAYQTYIAIDDNADRHQACK